MAPQPPNYRRISYVIPLPTENPPRLALPPLGAPRKGSIRPLLVPAPVSTPTPHSAQSRSQCANTKIHRRHRLGVSSLALDTSTQLAGKPSTEGILYSGGRDGQIIAWDLKLRTKKRMHRYGYTGRGSGSRKGRWEILTGWGEDMDEEEELDEEVVGSDGDILGDVVDSGGGKRRKSEALAETIPYEQTWELDPDGGPTPPSGFRQCIQTHTDWVNDILLCNLNQTVVSASSDGSVRAWSPHLSGVTEPALVGTHDDYVRCLTASPHQNWIASGSFDRTIKLWDISRTVASPSPSATVAATSNATPLSTLSLPTPSQKASVYALTTDQFGSVIASGSPERVVRMWDPRTGKRTGKLVGHTDIIRAVVLSADGRYLLTGSADASIKLWSLATQRCLHTFAHHTDSVWALSSQHPSLEIFYSGDRSGIVSRVDMEGCNTVDEGECLVVCNATRTSEDDSPEQNGRGCDLGDGFRLQDGTGVNKIVTLDDRLVWTATGSSSINRWKTPPRRGLRMGTSSFLASPESTAFSPGLASNSRRTSDSSDVHSPRRGFSMNFDGTRRISDELPLTAVSPTTPRSGKNFSTSTNFSHLGEEDTTLFGIPYQSLVRLVSPNEPYALGSPLSGGAYPRGVRRHTSRDTEIATLYSAASVKSVPMPVARHSVPPLAPASTLRSFRQNTGGTLGSRLMTVPPDTPDENWASSQRALYEDRDLAVTAVPLETYPDDTIHGENGLVRATVLNDRMHVLTVNTAGYVGVWDIARCRCVGWFDRGDVLAEMGGGHGPDGSSVSEHEFRSPRELLETVRERIEGESVIAPWATADTRVGNLIVHLSEKCFETEIYADEAGYGSERPYDTEQRLNVAKWILSNLFEGFVREELMKLRRPSPLPSNTSQRPGSQDSRLAIGRNRSGSALSSSSAASNTSRSLVSSIAANPSMTPAIVPDMSVINIRRPSVSLSTPLIPIVAVKDLHLSPIPQSPATLPSAGGTPTPRPRRDASETTGVSRSLPGKETDYFSPKTKRLSATSTPDDFSGWGGPGSKDKDGNTLPQTPSTPGVGGLMGRLRQLGKSSKRPLSGEIASSSGGSSASRPNEGLDDSRKEGQRNDNEPETEQSRFLGTLFSQAFHSPSSTDAPPLNLPLDTEIILAEETQSGWTNVYRGTVASTGADTAFLEKVMPVWLMQYLLSNKIPLVPNIKVSFGVAPWPGQEEPESAPTRLTANRYLRVRKILAYVQEKIDRPTSRSASRSGSISGATPRSSSEAIRVRSSSSSHSSPLHKAEFEGRKPRPEDIYEVLCNDIVLPLNMTLASIRHYVWRSSAELLLFYRRKV